MSCSSVSEQNIRAVSFIVLSIASIVLLVVGILGLADIIPMGSSTAAILIGASIGTLCGMVKCCATCH